MNVNYHFTGEEEIASPQLIYYRDIIEANIDRAIEIAGGAERLWPHVKSHKMQELVRLQMEKGVRRFKCATIAEAEMVARAGADALILAYPLIGPNIGRFMALRDAYPGVHMYAIFDSLEAAGMFSRALSGAGKTCSALLDVDMGMRRTGVPLERAEALYRALAALPGISMEGMHCYDGNRHERDYRERQNLVNEKDDAVKAMRDRLRKDGFACDIIVMGGTPSFPCHAVNNHEFLSPGTAIVHDAGYQANFPDLAFVPGAAILTRVVSLPDDHRFTLDCGHKAVAADSPVRGVLIGMEDCAEGVLQSEEHWVFQMKPGFEAKRPKIDDILYIVPWHVCPTSALYSEVPVVSGGKRVDCWQVTARNRKLTY